MNRAATSNGNGNGNGGRRNSNDDFGYAEPRPGDLAGAGGRDDDLPF